MSSASDSSSSGNPSQRFASARSISLERGFRSGVVRFLAVASTISTVSIVPPISASEQTSVSSDLVTAAWLMPVTSMNTRVVPFLSFVSSLLMIGGIERTWPLLSTSTG